MSKDPIVGIINYQSLGDSLNFLLTSKDPYKKFTNAYKTAYSPEIKNIIGTYIKEVYSKLKVNLSLTNPVDLSAKIGDIILVDNRYYLVTQYLNNEFITWPRTNDSDQKKYFENGDMSTFKIIRPDLDSTQNSVLEALDEVARDAIQQDPELQKLFTEDAQTFNTSAKSDTLSEGFLQVGDLIFLVDPTQISFSTQNGYQYFPTIRTAGNPKIPTMQQVKNISVTLIFPNEDSINYQLLHLYAMFKRTPFVNIRNKDICSFFDDICFGKWPSQWLSVGLESIQIQSVNGFPNTLQANLTFLPFDHKAISSGFKALRSVKDVMFQQALLYKNYELENLIRKSESKMNEQSFIPERFLDVIAKDIDSSPDFRQSLPFRAFYQSLISGREFILNDDGSQAEVSSETNVSLNTGYSIAKYRPIHKENMLQEYKSVGNSDEIKFSYSCLNKDFRDISQQLSDDRTEFQTQTLNQLKKLKESIQTKEGLVKELVSSFYTTEDFFKQVNDQLESRTNITQTLLSRYGITIDSDQDIKPVKNLVDLISRGALQQGGIEEMARMTKDLTLIAQGKITKDDRDISGLTTGLIFNSSVDDPGFNTNGVATVQHAIDVIWKYIEESEERRASFSAFLYDMRKSILGELGASETKTLISVDPNSEDTFKVIRLPIDNKTLKIDNKINVITGWSLVFSNKFVPVNLQAFKHPYYQHLGSDDPVISLNITSTSEKDLVDFKTELSTLSEKIYESVKAITMNAPELMTYMDGSIRIDSSPNNIFKVFGISKVSFDSSTTSNIISQPGSWSTNVSFTQNNFTIADYHSIESIPTFEKVKELISKILIGIEIPDNYYKVLDEKTLDVDNITNFVIKKYEVRSNTPEYVTKDVYSWNEASLDEILRLRFINSRWGVKFLTYLDGAKSAGVKAVQAKYISKSSSNSYNSTINGNIIDITNKSEIENTVKEDPLIAQRVADAFEKDSEFSKSLNIKITTDAEATNSINQLCIEFPEFKSLILSLVIQVDDLFKQQYNTLMSVIKVNESLFSVFNKKFSDMFLKYLPKLSREKTLVLLSLLIGSMGTLALGIGSLLTAGSLVGAGVATAEDSVIKGLINKTQDLFKNILENYNSSAISELANKIYKDPIIKDKLLTEKIIGTNGLEILNKAIIETRVNCYKDFDVPYLDDKVTLSPDFYLYNNIANDFELLTYFTEATKRYAKIGKLCLMMTLSEAEETLKSYQKVIETVQNVDSKIRTSVETILKSNLGEDIPSIIQSLQDTQVMVARAQDAADINPRIGSEEMAAWDKRYPKEKAENLQDWMDMRNSKLNSLILSRKGLSVEDLDSKKLNLIITARMKTLFEIFEISTRINQYMEGQLNLGSQKSTNKNRFLNLAKTDIEKQTIIKLNEHINLVLANAEKLTSQSMMTPSKFSIDSAEMDSLKKQTAGSNGFASTINDEFISLPDIRNLQAFVYNKIGFYIRLNTFINEYKEVGINGPISFDTIPELKFLEFWNFRAKEENERKLSILKNFWDAQHSAKNTTIKMFPTFKLFFLEEDHGIFRKFDDYYSHNAIQSIEIVENKNSASKTAIIRLSNVTNTLTDQLSLMREQAKTFGYATQIQEPDNIFFGTLDVKPGTAVLIKLGYAPFDNLLKTVFQGRIIEMNNGPIVQLVCQSYGAQLNHHIVSEKFGLLSTVREHGDVASAILDIIPGLENLGKISMFGFNNKTFSGKNLRNVRGKFFDKYLLGNLFGGVSSLVFAQDNPRDENIYLPYTFSTNILKHRTFDWVIFDQSVWSALQELTLYHRNVITTVKDFNDDPLSEKRDLRETLVIGDKGGFYKYTDAFALSSLNIKDVRKAIDDWQNIKPIFNTGGNPFTIQKLDSAVRIKKEFIPLFDFLQNELNTLVISAAILESQIGVQANPNFASLIADSITKNRLNPGPAVTLIEKIIQFSKYPKMNTDEILQFDFSSRVGVTEKVDVLNYINTTNVFNEQADIFNYIKSKLGNLNLDLTAERYFDVKVQVENTNQKLINNPQYKKIQQQHLITDVSDIISNNISLNSQFANMINVFYTKEPTLNTADINNVNFEKNVNIWPVKAFGDQKDEHTRVLNSYQKNIDTNWFDVVESVSNFFKGYSRSKNKDGEIKTILNQNGSTSKFDPKIPNWNIFPSFVVVGVNLLKQQVETMYQGTLEIVGNPNIKPFDIIHLQDNINDMHGAIEVEEVIHTFTPERGFRTTITPNLITFDRDPIQTQDIQIINQIYDFANARRTASVIGNLIGFGSFATAAIASFAAVPATGGLAAVPAIVGGASSSVAALGFLYNGLVGSYRRHHKFLYDQLGNILGRDCINFTSLLYHGQPYMAGFEGVDYTSLKTLMNHNVAGVQGPIARYAAFNDPLGANIITDFNPQEFGLNKSLFEMWKNPVFGGLIAPIGKDSRLK